MLLILWCMNKSDKTKSPQAFFSDILLHCSLCHSHIKGPKSMTSTPACKDVNKFIRIKNVFSHKTGGIIAGIIFIILYFISNQLQTKP